MLSSVLPRAASAATRIAPVAVRRTTTRQEGRDARAGAPVRHLVDIASFRLLDATPAGQAVRRAFRFQRPGDCVSHHETLRDELAHALQAQGVARTASTPLARRNPTALVPFGLWFPPPRLACIRQPRDARLLHALCERHGPLHLVLHGLAERQGQDGAYRTHHAAVLMATLRHGGRIIGLVVDGNDRQRNAPLQVLRLLAAARGDARPLAEWTPAELAASNRLGEGSARPGDPPPPPVHQAAWRIVDLQQALDVADAAWHATAVRPLAESLLPASHENMVSVDLQLQMVRPALDRSDTGRLLALLEESPGRVEDLGSPHGGKGGSPGAVPR